MGGQYDTRFVEERFSMDDAGEGKDIHAETAAILATLVAHRETERSANIVNRNERDASNWKWLVAGEDGIGQLSKGFGSSNIGSANEISQWFEYQLQILEGLSGLHNSYLKNAALFCIALGDWSASNIFHLLENENLATSMHQWRGLRRS
jgi:hypothetical protein